MQRAMWALCSGASSIENYLGCSLSVLLYNCPERDVGVMLRPCSITNDLDSLCMIMQVQDLGLTGAPSPRHLPTVPSGYFGSTVSGTPTWPLYYRCLYGAKKNLLKVRSSQPESGVLHSVPPKPSFQCKLGENRLLAKHPLEGTDRMLQHGLLM